jgi:hypothetical protein
VIVQPPGGAQELWQTSQVSEVFTLLLGTFIALSAVFWAKTILALRETSEKLTVFSTTPGLQKHFSL